MKHAYLITDTAYRMLYQARIFDVLYRYDIRGNTKNQKTDKVISRWEKMCLKICHLTLTHMILAVLLI